MSLYFPLGPARVLNGLLGPNQLSAQMSLPELCPHTYLSRGGGSREQQPPGPLLFPINGHRIRSAETVVAGYSGLFMLLP